MIRMMMIDDDESILENTLQLLEFAGYRVSGIDEGQKALQAIEDLQPDLILLDLKMRYFNGYDVMDAINERPWLQHIPVVIISAYADNRSIERSRRAGAVDYIVKPFTEDDLHGALSNILEH
ncbi:MAG: response regulator [Aggregatilineales bacterium]